MLIKNYSTIETVIKMIILIIYFSFKQNILKMYCMPFSSKYKKIGCIRTLLALFKELPKNAHIAHTENMNIDKAFIPLYLIAI